VSVHLFLVTAPDQGRMRMWLATSTYANWIEGRPNRHGTETWGVTVLGEHTSYFLDAARVCPVTLEEIEDAGDHERYVLLFGDPGTGWVPPDGEAGGS
jgi:hypothetical protein